MKKTASRLGRYKHSLVSEDFFLTWGHSLSALFEYLNEFRQQQILTDSELVALGVIAMLSTRSQSAFEKNGQSHKSLMTFPKSIQNQNIADRDELNRPDWSLKWLIFILRQFCLPAESIEKNFEHQLSWKVFDWLRTIRFRGIPQAGYDGLMNWLQGHYPLILCNYTPTSDEVFDWQMSGKRCVSFFLKTSELQEIRNGRDALSFTIHDLIHADEFYRHPTKMRQQIGFYKWIHQIEKHEKIELLKSQNQDFLTKWNYLRSDMNSYCGHLLKTVHATLALTLDPQTPQLLLGAEKPCKKNSLTKEANSYSSYSQSSPKESSTLWAELIEMSSLKKEQKETFMRLHTSNWNPTEDFFRVEQIFEEISQQ